MDISTASEVEHLSMVNYFGVGIDAAIALDFHLVGRDKSAFASQDLVLLDD